MSDLSLKLQGTNTFLQEFDSDGNKYLNDSECSIINYQDEVGKKSPMP